MNAPVNNPEMGDNKGPILNPEMMEEFKGRITTFADAAGEWADLKRSRPKNRRKN